MKRWVLRVAVVSGLLVATWYGLVGRIVARVKQNNASVAMMVTRGKIAEYVRAKGEWPHSWHDLLPQGKTSAEYEYISRTVTVNWEASVAEIDDFMEGVDAKKLEESFPPDLDLPLLVGFTARVPRDDDLEFSERNWNWMIAKSIYLERHFRENK